MSMVSLVSEETKFVEDVATITCECVMISYSFTSCVIIS